MEWIDDDHKHAGARRENCLIQRVDFCAVPQPAHAPRDLLRQRYTHTSCTQA
jgi:hypothetical protein